MEAARLDRARTGTHLFGPIQRTAGAGCNWTATRQAIGSRLPLDDLEAAHERVQAILEQLARGRELRRLPAATSYNRIVAW